MATTKKVIHYRSAVDGQYKTEAFAKKYPDKTVKETDKPKPKSPNKKK